VIINGASRSNGGFFARHLMRADHNERVSIVELRGLAYAQDVREAFREMEDLAAGTRCKNYFYHANLNTRADELLSAEQWAQATDKLEHALGLDGQPRLVVEHEKEGRVHRHVVWSRIDTDSQTAIHDGHNYRTHEEVAAELEALFGHQATQRALTRDKESTPRPEPSARDWETFRAQESGLDPKAMKAELTELWSHADSGQAFAAALSERGYILARGDRRDFCVIDPAGDEHSLARRISGVKAAEIRARMADIDREALPSVEEGRLLARQRPEDPETDGAASTPQETPAPAAADPVRQASIKEAQTTISPFDAVMAETVRKAEADAAAPAEEGAPGAAEHAGRFRAWWGTMRDYVQGFGYQVQDYWQRYFHRGEPEAAPVEQGTPGVTVSGAAHDGRMQSSGWTPDR
jgi:hypothetical protein